ncbi:hypothetical protein CNR29_00225 [Levilactobacillus brevis]|uniref:Uncharacterized protein n=1 Tax=Levilactobacillus brevis TaxID=1580 RepID=A0A2A3TU25_LEVBR|nr:hypothetical protein [Levilactobacillus brevis]PBQ22522.1 hypothetical protein CNR29_00225 [Levilactobacillus brevis]
MKNVLFGNGLNMKFGGNEYRNGEILQRGFDILSQDKTMQILCPPETLEFFNKMYESASDVANGLYDDAADDCESELHHFKINYGQKSIDDIGQVGMEDYFLVLHLMFRWNRKYNSMEDAKKIFSIEQERMATECFRDLCLVGIYNLGNINNLSKRYSKEFISYINDFDNVFTTNYDLNLDEVYNGTVQHIHGQFNILDQLYDPHSFRNSLSDDQFRTHNLKNIPGYEYLHSTALMNYSGKSKFNYMMNEHRLNNLSMEDILALPAGSAKESEIKLALEAKERMKKDSSLRFQEYDAYENFKKISGSLTIIGLSPENDNHIFDQVNKLNTIFYYYSDEDKISAENTMKKSTSFKKVSDLWKKLES